MRMGWKEHFLKKSIFCKNRISHNLKQLYIIGATIYSPQDLEMVNKRVRESDLEEVIYLFIDIFHYKLWSAFKDVSKLSKERNTINLSRLRKDSIKHSPPGLSRSPSKRQEWAEAGLLRTFIGTTWTTEKLKNYLDYWEPWELKVFCIVHPN